ncbi:MAG: hypothetical protein AAGM38_07910 [Pseudomonadota bacterium]
MIEDAMADAFIARAHAATGLDRRIISASVAPAIGFNEASLSGQHTARIGGAPQLAKGSSWPHRSPLPNAEEFDKWLKRSDETENWASNVPFLFLAEFDLAAAQAA